MLCYSWVSEEVKGELESGNRRQDCEIISSDSSFLHSFDLTHVIH
jgi:hypothetical protein